MSLNINQEIERFNTERATHVQKMASIFETAAGQTFDAKQQEEYDTAEQDIDTIDQHLGRLRKHQAILASNVTTVVDVADGKKAGSIVQARTTDGVIAVAKKLPPGVGFTRVACLAALAKGNWSMAESMAREQYPEDKPMHDLFSLYAKGKIDNTRLIKDELFTKAVVAAGTTIDSHWAAPLVNYQNLVDEFLEFLRPQVVIDRTPGLRRVPFNVKVPRQVTGGAAYWVGEGKPKPLTSFNFEQVVLGYMKIANISVITQELARLSSPSAETTVRDQLAAAIIQQMDADYLDPANAGTANVKPASITNGAPTIAATGTNTAALLADIRSLFNIWIAANQDPTRGLWYMSASEAMAISMIYTSLGQPYPWNAVTPKGGTLFGLPVIVSQTAGLHGTSGSESIIVLANPGDILVADDGRVTVDSSSETALQMLDNPTNASSDGTATSMVSMFQTDSLAIRAERWITWVRGRTEAVAYITNANYIGG